MNRQELQYLLKKYNLTPNKVRGQNFLISDQVLDRIIGASDITRDDLVIEVGAGLGALTSRLITEAGFVYSMEIEKSFAPVLRRAEETASNLEIVWQDVLSLDDGQIKDMLRKRKVKKYKIVANIPYYLTGKLIQKFLTTKYQPQSMTLLIQKEVAERMLAKDNKQSLLSLSVGLYAKCRIICQVPSTKFYPQPKVDSAVIKLSDIHPWNEKSADEDFTWQIIHRGFAQKRKKLVNNLAADSRLKKELILATLKNCGLDQNIRAERLTVADWMTISKTLKNSI